MAEALDVIAPRLLTPVQAALHPNVPAGAGLGRREDMSTGQPNRAEFARGEGAPTLDALATALLDGEDQHDVLDHCEADQLLTVPEVARRLGVPPPYGPAAAPAETVA